MRWQRILRPALGLFALAFAIWVGVSIRTRKPGPPAAAATRTDKDAVVGRIADTPGVHGVAVVSSLGRASTQLARCFSM